MGKSLLTFIVLVSFTSGASAVNVWWYGTYDNDWFNQKNYSNNAVPGTDTGVNWSNSGVGPRYPIVINSGSALCSSLWSYNEYDSHTRMTIAGGTLTSSSGYLLAGSGSIEGDSTFYLQGGAVNFPRVIVGADIYGGNGTGTLHMTGGTLTTPSLELNKAGDKGVINLYGGTINATAFAMESSHRVDITYGTMILDGNKTGTINTYINNGWMVGFGGNGTVLVDYGNITPNKTTVTAQCDVAWNPDPKDGQENVGLYADLSWSPGDYYSPTEGYNVYFGTDFNDVNDFTDPYTPPGRGNQLEDTYDPWPLDVNTTYYWRIDEVNDFLPLKGNVWSFRVGSGSPYDDYIIDFSISTGDNHYLPDWLPVESPNAIDDVFDMLKDVYNTRRIYWRGLQEQQWAAEPVLRPDWGHPTSVSAFKWFEHLVKDVNLDPYAVQAAHSRGMEIWGTGNLFDWGSSPEVPINTFPCAHETQCRVDHREWVPVDKYGVRRQGGPVELAYPEAREKLIDIFVTESVKAGYDGMLLLAFAENYCMRFQDEFGFNDPIVDEFKSRYGVDIRTEAFNRQDWYDLRGEYVTQFLTELKAALTPYGIKLGFAIYGGNPSIPDELIMGGSGISTAGHITMDYETWVQQGIVDLLQVTQKGGLSNRLNTVAELNDLTIGTSTETNFRTSPPYDSDFQSFMEAGMASVAEIGGPDELFLLYSKIPEQPLSALEGTDVYKIMRVLAQIMYGQTSATVADVAPFVSHPNILVRRLAFRALGRLDEPAGLSLIEDGLNDPEGPVRNAAMVALGDTTGPESAQKILDAIDNYGNHMLHIAALYSLINCDEPSISATRQLLASAIVGHEDPIVRETAARVLDMMMASDSIDAAIYGMGDLHPAVRFYCTEALNSSAAGSSTVAVEALLNGVKNDDIMVSNRAALALGNLVSIGGSAAVARESEILEALGQLYRKTAGSLSQRADAEWSFRPVGNALLDLGPDGQALLESFRTQRADMKLAQKAWLSLYIPQKEAQFVLATEAESDIAFQQRPAAFGFEDLAEFLKHWLDYGLFP